MVTCLYIYHGSLYVFVCECMCWYFIFCSVEGNHFVNRYTVTVLFVLLPPLSLTMFHLHFIFSTEKKTHILD